MAMLEIIFELLFYPRLWAGLIFGSMIGAIISYFIFGHFEVITISISILLCCVLFSIVLEKAAGNSTEKDN